MGLWSTWIVTPPILTRANCQKQLQYAQLYRQSLDIWWLVAFSDESGGGGSIMVWGMLSWYGLGPLLPEEGTLNWHGYLSITVDQAHLHAFNIIMQHFILHAIVDEWFTEHDQDFQLLSWSPNSPDLNPIEYIWDHLNWYVWWLNPPPHACQQMLEALQCSWVIIPITTIQDLIESLLWRLVAVCAARGGYSEC